MIGYKKSQGPLPGTIIFIILNVIFFSLLFIFIGNVGKDDTTLEKIYAKEFSLLIDGLRPGTKVILYVPDLFDAALKNHYSGNIIFPDYTNNKLTIKVNNNGGYSAYYLPVLKEGAISVNVNDKTLIIQT